LLERPPNVASSATAADAAATDFAAGSIADVVVSVAASNGAMFDAIVSSGGRDPSFG